MSPGGAERPGPGGGLVCKDGARGWALALVAAVVAAVVSGLVAAACGSDPSRGAPGGPTAGQSMAIFGEAGTFTSTASDEAGPDDGGAAPDAFVLPGNFVPTQMGGYALGAPIAGNGATTGIVQNGSSASCALVVGVVRDFLSYGLQDGGDPDFEHFMGGGPTLGLVQKAIGADRKPVYGAECDDNGSPNPPCRYGQQMTTQANFDEWYRYTPGVNAPYLVYLQFVPNGNVYTFQSNAFFPLDGAGFGNTPGYRPQLQLHDGAAPQVHVQRRRDVQLHRGRRPLGLHQRLARHRPGRSPHALERVGRPRHARAHQGDAVRHRAVQRRAPHGCYRTSAWTRTSPSATAGPFRRTCPGRRGRRRPVEPGKEVA